MLSEGVSIAPAQFESGFIGIAHGQTELDQIIETARKVFRNL